MKLTSPKGVGFQVPKVLKTINTSCLQSLSVKRCLVNEWRNMKRRKGNLVKLTKTNDTFSKHLKACTTFLKWYGK